MIILSILSGCKTWNIGKLKIAKEPISPKLLTLNKKFKDIVNAPVVTNPDQILLFTKEVEENLIDPYGDKYGYIVMKQTVLKSKASTGLLILNVFTSCIPVLFGCPFTTIKISLEIELRILDSNNKLLGKYAAVGTQKNTCAMYYGYSMVSIGRKTYTDAVMNAFNLIRPQIKAEAESLNQKLKEAGKIN